MKYIRDMHTALANVCLKARWVSMFFQPSYYVWFLQTMEHESRRTHAVQSGFSLRAILGQARQGNTNAADVEGCHVLNNVPGPMGSVEPDIAIETDWYQIIPQTDTDCIRKTKLERSRVKPIGISTYLIRSQGNRRAPLRPAPSPRIV